MSSAENRSLAGSLRVPDGVTISFSTSLPQHVTFAGQPDRMRELVEVLRSTAEDMENNLAARAMFGSEAA